MRPESHQANIELQGHILISEKETGNILLDKMNAIHPENMSQALAFCLAARGKGNIFEMVFGNGGSTVSAVGTIDYYSPNTTGASSQLYNQTYAKIVNDMSTLNTNNAENYLRVNHTANTNYSDVVITCSLDIGEPSDQDAFDNAGSVTGKYIFNELGIKSYDPTASSGIGLLLTHAIFHPVQKASNVAIVVTYTIRIIVS